MRAGVGTLTSSRHIQSGPPILPTPKSTQQRPSNPNQGGTRTVSSQTTPTHGPSTPDCHVSTAPQHSLGLPPDHTLGPSGMHSGRHPLGLSWTMPLSPQLSYRAHCVQHSLGQPSHMPTGLQSASQHCWYLQSTQGSFLHKATLFKTGRGSHFT